MSEKVKMETTKKELTEEASDFIKETCKNIILDALPCDQLDNYLYSITVTTDKETGDYNAAVLYLFGIPKELDELVCVNTLRIDLATRQINTLPVFFAPVVLIRNKNGVPTDTMIVGRYGNISVTEAYLTSSVAPADEIAEYYLDKEETEEEK